MSDFVEMTKEEELTKHCQDNGLKLIVRGKDELLLDIDRPGKFPKEGEERKRFVIFQKEFPVESIEQWKSKSGNTHVRIKLIEDVSEIEALCLQFFLMSDPYRGFFATKSVMSGKGIPTALFVPEGNTK